MWVQHFLYLVTCLTVECIPVQQVMQVRRHADRPPAQALVDMLVDAHGSAGPDAHAAPAPVRECCRIFFADSCAERWIRPDKRTDARSWDGANGCKQPLRVLRTFSTSSSRLQVSTPTLHKRPGLLQQQQCTAQGVERETSTPVASLVNAVAKKT